MDSLETARAM
jgi:hypothetical protein